MQLVLEFGIQIILKSFAFISGIIFIVLFGIFRAIWCLDIWSVLFFSVFPALNRLRFIDSRAIDPFGVFSVWFFVDWVAWISTQKTKGWVVWVDCEKCELFGSLRDDRHGKYNLKFYKRITIRTMWCRFL